MDFNTIQWLITFSGFAIAAMTFYFSRKKETSDSVAQAAKVASQLESIGKAVDGIQDDVKEMRREWHDDHDKIVSMERDIKAIWKQVDKINGKDGEQ